MQIPVARFVVNLYITRPHLCANSDFGICKVGTGIFVGLTWRYHFDEPAITCPKLFQRKDLKHPGVLEELFHYEFGLCL